MRIASRGLTAVTVGLVSAVVLASCSSNSNKPTVLPSLQTTSTTPSAVATTPAPAPVTTTASAAPATTAAIPTTTPPTKHVDPLATADRAIEKTVHNYYATVNKAIGDPVALKNMKELFGPGCAQCVSDASNFAKLQAKQWTVVGGTYHIISVEGTAAEPKSGGATVTFDVLPATVRDKNGQLVASEAAHSGRSEGLSVGLVGGHWKILGYVSFGSSK
jgi:hypothetical protein